MSSVGDHAGTNPFGQTTPLKVDPEMTSSCSVESKTAKTKNITGPPISTLLDVYPSERDPSRFRVRGVDGDDFTAKGRVVGVRRHGSKLFFLDVVGDYEQLQIIVNFKTLQSQSPAEWADATVEEFRAKADKIQRGDWVVVAGHMEMSKRGSLRMSAHNLPSIHAKPAIVPPESVTDDELKARSRHLDLMLNQESVDALRVRARVVKTIRRVLDDSSYVEVQTPLLSSSAGGAAARPFSTTAIEFGHSQPLALRVAPELWLKRLIVGGMERVYEIGPCFRNEGIDGTHNPEFTMCEFYEAWARLDHLMLMTERLMNLIAADLERTGIRAQATGRRAWRIPDVHPTASKFWEEGKTPQVHFVSALEEALGFKLPDLESSTAMAELTARLRERGRDADILDSGDNLDLPKLLDHLGSRYVENRGPAADGMAFFVTHHPACMAPLARSRTCLTTGQKVALRAEFFVDGVELANMYEEEFEACEQERKFKAVALSRITAQAGAAPATDDITAVELDDNEASYVEALRAGMPPTGGWGCGVDRLTMMFTGAPRIRDVLAFGNLRNVLSSARLPPGAKTGVVQKDSSN